MTALRKYVQSAFFGKPSDGKTCLMCKKDAIVFKDEISKREYKITGFCQLCQDDLFDDMEQHTAK